MYKFLSTLFFVLLSIVTFSQNLKLEGIVSGYNYNPNKGIFKKGTDILLDGKLENAKINVYKGKSIIKSGYTNTNGEYRLSIPTGEWYIIEVSKKGFNAIRFNLDLTHVNNNISLRTLELILNSHIPKKKTTTTPFGILGYNSRGFYFKEADFNSKSFSKYIDYSPLVSLIKKSILKNSDKNNASNTSKNTSSFIDNSYNNISNDTLNTNDVSTQIIKNSNVYTNLINKKDEVDIENKEQTILNAKKQLAIDKKNAKTELDFLLIKDRELLISAAEKELVQLKKIIKQKEETIALKNNQIWLFLGLLLLLSALVLYVLKSNSIKNKLNTELSLKNKKINDSITYAEKIQTAILPSISDFNKLLPNSFILYKPKDKVSGDYYWFEEIDNKIIVAAVDCTGHGVPGAFMSMIGNTLMNNIIIENKITSPKAILNSLNKKLQTALKQDNKDPFASQDGMDLSICVIDKINKTITYAGAMNSLYLVTEQEIEILEVSKRGIGGYDVYNNGAFLEYSITLNKNSKLYMFSDGFQDQFGGENNEKFNVSRFKKLLRDCYTLSSDKEKQLIEKTLKDWQLNNEQTDDILLLGISL